MIIILTKKPKNHFLDTKYYLLEIKSLIKYLLGKNRGPDAVIKSVVDGFNKIGVEFKLNPEKKIIKNDIVWVIKDHNVLKYAIELKKNGLIERLLAGPTISILPEDHGGILLDKNIDTIIFPSQWTKDFFVSKYNFLKDKIRICPAGLKDIYRKENKIIDFLIYNKNNKDNCKKIVQILKQSNYTYKIVTYGNFKQNKYYNLLNRSRYMIYLSDSESQGIALNEAWMCNVPTFVLQNTEWKYGNNTWKDEKISAPYLTDELGLFFTVENLQEKIDIVLKNKDYFKPRKYSLENFSDKVVAYKLLNIIKNVK